MIARRWLVIEADDGGWRILDVRTGEWLNRYGEVDRSYRAPTREIAEMRVRDWTHAPGFKP